MIKVESIKVIAIMEIALMGAAVEQMGEIVDDTRQSDELRLRAERILNEASEARRLMHKFL